MADTDELTRTTVDLGDDLLHEKTRVPEFPPPRRGLEDIDSALILLGEGLVEDAKKIFRKILAEEPGNGLARSKLREIQEREIREILSGTDRPKRARFRGEMGESLGIRETSAPRAEEVDAREILRALDHELKLGVFEPGEVQAQAAWVGQTLLQQVEQKLKELTSRDLLDLGIAFFEMGFFDAAATAFHWAAAEDQSENFYTARSLEVVSRIEGGQAFEGILLAEALLSDQELPDEVRVGLLYLVGQAYEAIDSPISALTWYLKVKEWDPSYRDVADRIRALQRKN